VCVRGWCSPFRISLPIFLLCCAFETQPAILTFSCVGYCTSLKFLIGKWIYDSADEGVTLSMPMMMDLHFKEGECCESPDRSAKLGS
jgi:hypothetical protein